MFDLSDDAMDELAAQTGGIPDFIMNDPRFNLEDEASSSIATPPRPPSTVNPAALMDTSSSSSSSSSSRALSSSYPSSVTSSGLPSTPPSSDSYLLPVNELTLLRAFMRIAARLGSSGSLWDLSACSPFCLTRPTEGPIDIGGGGDGICGGGGGGGGGGPSPPNPALLPPTWQPTTTQLLVPHHPVLDFLPWPSARDRVIEVFGLPESERPPAAAGPLALVEFAYDAEDSAEGMRIWGSDPYDPTGWEVGQVLFERWWFIFDRPIIEQSNRWRALRGAGALTLKGQKGRPDVFSMEM